MVITMLADPTAVREVIDGIARHLRPGTTLIDASTIGPQAVQEVAALLPGSVALIDAPVMGSADRAASGQLAVLAGGNITKARPQDSWHREVVHATEAAEIMAAVCYCLTDRRPARPNP